MPKSEELPSRQTGDQTFCGYMEVPLYFEYKFYLHRWSLSALARLYCKISKIF